MRSLFEICIPRPDILAGNIKEADFAADLARVINGNAPADYQDPRRFFEHTHPTDGLKNLLKTVCQRLSDRGGVPILRLDTQYGGGKTHALIALTHAATGMAGVANASEFIDPDLIPRETVRIATFDGENADPANGRPLGDGFRAFTPWGEIAYGLAGAAGYEKVRQSDIERVAPGAATLSELFDDNPVLILIDELSIYLRKIKGRKEQEQLTPFLTALFKAVASHPKACAVFTLAIGKEGKARDAYTSENESIDAKMQEASKVAGRMATLLTPTTEKETTKVLRRRLFASVDEDVARETVEAYRKLWNSYRDDLPVESLQDDRTEEFLAGYPFHPALMDLLTDKLATLSTFQRVRGMLRLLTRTVTDLWGAKPDNTYALHLHHINPGSGPIRDEINARLELGRFDPVIENDVAARESGNSLAEQLDRRHYRGLADYGSFVARDILWHSLAFNDALQGIDKKTLRYSILAPNLDIGFINDAWTRFVQDSAYLDDRPTAPLRFLTEVNLTQLINRQKQQVDLDEARVQLQDRIRSIFDGKTFNLILFPQDPHDVPDDAGNGKPLLVVIGYDAIAIPPDSVTLPDIVERIYNSGGASEGFRHLKNNLVFLVADETKREEMKDKIKYRLALEAMRSPARLQQLPEHQQDKVQELFKRSEQEIAILIQQCYRHLFYPSQEGLENATIDLPAASQKPGDGQQQVLQTLIAGNKLYPPSADPPQPSFVRDRTPLKNGQITTAELRLEFRKNTRLPILLGDDLFTKMIRQGIERNLFVYRQGDLLLGPGDAYADIKIEEGAYVYTLDHATEHGIWPRPPVTPPSPVYDPSPSGKESRKVKEDEEQTPYDTTGEITAPAPVETTLQAANLFKYEAPLREALTRVWENARNAGVKKIDRLTLRVFDAGDAFKLMGAIGRVTSGEVSVKLTAAYETAQKSKLEMEFQGMVTDAAPIRDFLQAQFRASDEKDLDTIFTIAYPDGLSLQEDAPEKVTEQLARFATGTALVEAIAEAGR
jgi:hypothetical protein